MRRTLVVVVFFLLLVGLWHLATSSGRWSPVLLPSPVMVGEYLWGALRDGSLFEAVEVTLRRLVWSAMRSVSSSGCRSGF